MGLVPILQEVDAALDCPEVVVRSLRGATEEGQKHCS